MSHRPTPSAEAILVAIARRERLDQGRSLRDVAACAGLSHSFLSKLERGERPPTPRALHRLILALDLVPSDVAVALMKSP